MEKIVILQGITVEQLLSLIDKAIEKRITEVSQKKQPVQKVRYMSRKEVAEYLHIALTTLHFWTKTGLIKSYKIGNRVLYRNDEINESVQGRKFSR